jgi:hypothetical protein
MNAALFRARAGSLCTGALLLLYSSAIGFAQTQKMGRVVDASTGAGIAGALVTSPAGVVHADAEGRFRIAPADRIAVRAYGYGRAQVNGTAPSDSKQEIKLTRLTPRAVYLSYWGVSSSAVREPVLQLPQITPVNAVVIDVKGDLGYISYRADVPLASRIGAEKIATIPDIYSLLDRLHSQGLYVIGRIVTFKDNTLAMSDPELQIHLSGKLWRDREGLAWCDPFRHKAWQYNIAVAVDAAKAGFDEIQFDYVRFPDSKGIEFSEDSTEQSRSRTISGFLKEAREALIPYNVFLSADVFGYICWNNNDTGIGQQIEQLATVLDYISPMLYPSGFAYGIPSYRNPITNSYEIVRLSLDRARERTHLDPIRFRPWLQAFADYAFDKRQFGAGEIQSQIRAAESFGSDGWQLWNPRNSYTAQSIRPGAAGARASLSRVK